MKGEIIKELAETVLHLFCAQYRFVKLSLLSDRSSVTSSKEQQKLCSDVKFQSLKAAKGYIKNVPPSYFNYMLLKNIFGFGGSLYTSCTSK